MPSTRGAQVLFEPAPAPPASCDPNQDGRVDISDVAIIKLHLNGFPLPEADCQQDGFINEQDMAALLGGAAQPAAVLVGGRLVAVEAPTPSGHRWVADLSAVAADADFFVIQDGENLTIQRGDMYLLQPSALTRAKLDIVVHHANGKTEAMTVGVITPPQVADLLFRERVAFFFTLECLVLLLFVRFLRRR